MDQKFLTSRILIVLSFLAIGELLPLPSQAVDNIYFLCTPSKFTQIQIFGETREEIPCTGAEKNQDVAPLCKKFRMEVADLTTNGAYYEANLDSSGSTLITVNTFFQLSRAQGSFLMQSQSALGYIERTGSCDLQKETLKY